MTDLTADSVLMNKYLLVRVKVQAKDGIERVEISYKVGGDKNFHQGNT